MREFREMQKKQMKDWLRINKAAKGNRIEKRSKLNEFKRKQQQEEVTFLENALKRRQELERDTQQQQAEQLSTLSQQVISVRTIHFPHSFQANYESLPSTRMLEKLYRQSRTISSKILGRFTRSK